MRPTRYFRRNPDFAALSEDITDTSVKTAEIAENYSKDDLIEFIVEDPALLARVVGGKAALKKLDALALAGLASFLYRSSLRMPGRPAKAIQALIKAKAAPAAAPKAAKAPKAAAAPKAAKAAKTAKAPKVTAAAPKAAAKPAKATKAAKSTDYAKREAARSRLIAGQVAAGDGNYIQRERFGPGPFRYVIVRSGKIVVDAGPLPTAREAAIAAKTLLRTKAKAFVNPISQKGGRALIDTGSTGLEKYGRVVDGYVVDNMAGDWEAFVYQPFSEEIAYEGGRGFQNLRPPPGSGLKPLSLLNVPDDFVLRAPPKPPAASKAAKAKSNPNEYDYLYVLQGNYGYGHGYEDLSAYPKTAKGLKEAKADRAAYRDSGERADYRIISRRERA